MVGLGRLELPTSPLSGVRSNHLSYRPVEETGGAGRDRTGDLLNANQALSQLSYSPYWIDNSHRMLEATLYLGSLREIFLEADWTRDPGGKLTGSRKETRND